MSFFSQYLSLVNPSISHVFQSQVAPLHLDIQKHICLRMTLHKAVSAVLCLMLKDNLFAVVSAYCAFASNVGVLFAC
jgi:hypothetical protein